MGYLIPDTKRKKYEVWADSDTNFIGYFFAETEAEIYREFDSLCGSEGIYPKRCRWFESEEEVSA